MSKFSQFLHFIFDPVHAAAARAASSANPVAKSIGVQVLDVVAQSATAGSQALQSGNSAAGTASTIIATLENGLNSAVGGYVETVVDGLPLVGEMIAPAARDGAIAALVFAEQHAMTMVAALFSHHRAQIDANLAPPAAVTAQPVAPAAIPVGAQ